MNLLRNFSQFIKEGSENYDELVKLGLASRNQEFFKDLERILELCPNLSYITYPYSATPGGMSRKIPSGEPDLNQYRIIYSKLEADGLIDDITKQNFKTLSREYRFEKRLELVKRLAVENYGEDYLESVKDEIRQLAQNEISEMLQTLREIDSSADVELRVWDLGGWRIKYNSFKKHGQYVDMRTAIEMLEQDPEMAENIDKLQITVVSKGDDDFGMKMSRGDFGSLD